MAKKPLPETKAWHPPPYEKMHALAFKALAAGNANEHQQKIALNWLINVAAGTYDMTFRPEGDRDSCFAEGRRFVGTNVVKLINIPMDVFDEKRRPNG